MACVQYARAAAAHKITERMVYRMESPLAECAVSPAPSNERALEVRLESRVLEDLPVELADDLADGPKAAVLVESGRLLSRGTIDFCESIAHINQRAAVSP